MMTPRERLTHAIAAAARKPAMVAFLTAGYPERAQFRAHLAAIASAADAIEVGVPFTDPMADGVTIQRSSRAALAQGVSLRWILDELAREPRIAVPVLLMSYLNPLLALGFEPLAAQAAAAGVCGLIVPDLPFDESAELGRALAAHSIALVHMVTPVTEARRLREICGASEGFVYAVTSTGTTGRDVAVPEGTLAYLDRVRAAARVPVCAGFGIRTAEQVARLREHADGVIVGSALVERLERGDDPAAWLRTLRATA